MPAPARVRTGSVVLALVVTLALGALLKAQPSLTDGLRTPCLDGVSLGAERFTRLCYSDVVALSTTEHLADGRLPYVDPCPRSADRPGSEPVCDEYPVVTMLVMWLAARTSAGPAGFFWINALILGAAAVITALCLQRLVGRRALWFAAAPTLLVSGFTNWDLLAVACSVGALWALLRRRDGLSGGLLGAGAAAKLFPGLLIVPFAAHRLHRGDAGDAGRTVLWAAGVWTAINLPFAILGFDGWSRFYRLSAGRPADLDSLWFIGCRWVTGSFPCLHDPSGVLSSGRLVNALSAVAFVASAIVVWQLRRRRDPAFPRWSFALPLLIVFLLTSKVYSPQFSLWLLPWFALALPSVGRISALALFVAFEVADVGVFVTRNTWLGAGGLPQEAFELAVLVRALILIACVVAWVTAPTPPLAAADLVATGAARGHR
jgi:uncharacterized membrane protein